MKKQITIKDFHKLNNIFDKMKMAISFLEDKEKNMHLDVLKEHLQSACDFWVDLYKKKGI